ncbi:MAG: hypothetical protein ACKV2U_10610 [Bryobacteraceae bacterium]
MSTPGLPLRRGRWLLAGALIAMPVHAQLGLGLSPMRLEFPATKGKAYSGTLALTNSADKTVRVRTEIMDFFVDSNQTPQFMPNVAAEAEHSCRQWITINPMETEVEPKRQISARYTVRVPADAGERSYHCAIGFVTLPTTEDLQGIGVRTALRVVTTVYPIVGQPMVKGEIAELALEAVAAGDKMRWRGVVVMANAGLMLYRPQGRMAVVDGGGKVVETLEIASFPVLPKRRQRFLLPLKSELAAGRYTLRAHIDVGTEVQEASVEVTAELPKR